MSMFTRLGFRSDSDDWVVSWESLGSWMQTRFEVSVNVDESANKTFFFFEPSFKRVSAKPMGCDETS